MSTSGKGKVRGHNLIVRHTTNGVAVLQGLLENRAIILALLKFSRPGPDGASEREPRQVDFNN